MQHRGSCELGSHQGDRPSSKTQEGKKRIHTADSKQTQHLIGSVLEPVVVEESLVIASEKQTNVTSNVKNNETEKFYEDVDSSLFRGDGVTEDRMGECFQNEVLPVGENQQGVESTQIYSETDDSSTGESEDISVPGAFGNTRLKRRKVTDFVSFYPKNKTNSKD